MSTGTPSELAASSVEDDDDERLFELAERLYATDLAASRTFWEACLTSKRPFAKRLPSFFLARRFGPDDRRRIAGPDRDLLLRTTMDAARWGDASASLSALTALGRFLDRATPKGEELGQLTPILLKLADNRSALGERWPLVADQLDTEIQHLLALGLLHQTFNTEELRRLAEAGLESAGVALEADETA